MQTYISSWFVADLASLWLQAPPHLAAGTSTGRKAVDWVAALAATRTRVYSILGAQRTDTSCRESGTLQSAHFIKVISFFLHTTCVLTRVAAYCLVLQVVQELLQGEEGAGGAEEVLPHHQPPPPHRYTVRKLRPRFHRTRGHVAGRQVNIMSQKSNRICGTVNME